MTTAARRGRPASWVPAAARGWWAIAATVTVVSLGMPWKGSTLWPMYNIYNPWNCGVDWGGEAWASSRWCFQTLPTYSWFEGEASPGYQTPVRIFVVLALVAVFLGLRLGRRGLTILGAATATAGAVVASTSVGPGQTVYLIGVAALWIGLHRAGMIGRSPSLGGRSPSLGGRSATSAAAPTATD